MLQRFSRRTWIVAIVASVLCVAALAVALARHWDEPPSAKTIPREVTSDSNGFGLGLVVGVAVGVVATSVFLALRRKE